MVHSKIILKYGKKKVNLFVYKPLHPIGGVEV